MLSKKELLSGYQRIVDFSQTDKCYLLIPKIDGSLIELMIRHKELSTITMRMDRLVGKWLKVKKYFVIPEDKHLCSILFLQPIWINPGFIIHLTDAAGNSVGQMTPASLSHSGLDEHAWLNENLMFALHHSIGKRGLSIPLSMALPFVFIQLTSLHHISRKDSYHPVPLDNENLNIFDFNLHQEDFQIHNYGDGLFPSYRLITTSDPSIYLLVFSDLLQTSKDCAKLLRRFMKNPDNPVWAFNGSALLFCNCQQNIIMSIPKLRGKPEPDDPADHAQSFNFEDRVFLDTIQAFGFTDD